MLANSGLRVATVERACAAFALAHRLAEHDSPTLHPEVALTLEGIRRELGIAAQRALVREVLRLITTATGGELLPQGATECDAE